MNIWFGERGNYTPATSDLGTTAHFNHRFQDLRLTAVVHSTAAYRVGFARTSYSLWTTRLHCTFSRLSPPPLCMCSVLNTRFKRLLLLLHHLKLKRRSSRAGVPSVYARIQRHSITYHQPLLKSQSHFLKRWALKGGKNKLTHLVKRCKKGEVSSVRCHHSLDMYRRATYFVSTDWLREQL